MARTQPLEDCMIMASMKRLSTPVEFATSRIDSSMAEISSGLLRATSQVSHESLSCCWLLARLECWSDVMFIGTSMWLCLQVFEGKPLVLRWPAFGSRAIAVVALVERFSVQSSCGCGCGQRRAFYGPESG